MRLAVTVIVVLMASALMSGCLHVSPLWPLKVARRAAAFAQARRPVCRRSASAAPGVPTADRHFRYQSKSDG
jgi:hypothetical protein